MSVLDEANEIINGDRQKDYGSAYATFSKIANLWSVVLDTNRPISPQEVALCLIQLKVARAINDTYNQRPIKRDTIVDIAGYAGCIEKIQDEESK